jgi:hypothetical protein
MKLLSILLLILFSGTAYGIELKNTQIYGESNYSIQGTEKLSTTMGGDYSLCLYESKSKFWALSLNGKVVIDFDHLNTELKTNVFTTIGIDF